MNKSKTRIKEKRETDKQTTFPTYKFGWNWTKALMEDVSGVKTWASESMWAGMSLKYHLLLTLGLLMFDINIIFIEMKHFPALLLLL